MGDRDTDFKSNNKDIFERVDRLAFDYYKEPKVVTT